MIHKTRSPKAGYVRVIFELPASLWADKIYLVGDFNDWDTAVTPFIQGRDGVWRAVLDLPCGREFQFRYLVDGRWQTDYHADGWVENEYGSQNSIVQAILPPDEALEVLPPDLVHEKDREPSGLHPAGQEPPVGPLAIPKSLERQRRIETQLAG